MAENCGICKQAGASTEVDPVDKVTLDIDGDFVHDDCLSTLVACQNASTLQGNIFSIQKTSLGNPKLVFAFL